MRRKTKLAKTTETDGDDDSELPLKRPALVLDDWQKEILAYDGDILLKKGRRIGGTEIFSIKSVEEMRKGKRIVMVSHTEDQAKLIIIFALEYIQNTCPKEFFLQGTNKPTQTKVQAKSGGWLQVRPVGNTGDAVRGFDADILGIDEAPIQPKQMWAAARPVISTNNGTIWMWGTPKGKEGYFWEQYNKGYNLKQPCRFKIWDKNTEQILEERPISETWTIEQREGLRRILDEEKADMSRLEYGQEYLGLFMEEIQRLFPEDLLEQAEKIAIKKADASNIKQTLDFSYCNNFLGVDIARMGEDKSAFSVVTKHDDGYYNHCYMTHIETTEKTFTNETEDKILELARLFNISKIGIDAGSGTLGVSILDHILNTEKFREIAKKTIALNKREIALDRDKKKKLQLLGTDMYLNLLSMIQHNEISILDDDNVWASLRNVLYEYETAPNQKTRLRVFFSRHEDSDIAESLIRAAWLANQKSLNLHISYV